MSTKRLSFLPWVGREYGVPGQHSPGRSTGKLNLALASYSPVDYVTRRNLFFGFGTSQKQRKASKIIRYAAPHIYE